MDSHDDNQNSNIFYRELNELLKHNFINQNQFNEMSKAYSKLKIQRKYNATRQQQAPYNMPTQSTYQTPNQGPYPIPTQGPYQTPIHATNQVPYQGQYQQVNVAPMSYTGNNVVKPNINRVEKKVKSADEIRERNITWSLILGVIMLLTAGLILSTTNWQYMNELLKVISIASVSILFLSLSWFTEKILKIKKTSFAFLILGSSFVPIVFVGIGFFELFGRWLSFYGEGKYILGLLGSLISCIVYSVNAKRNNSRLFRWLS